MPDIWQHCPAQTRTGSAPLFGSAWLLSSPELVCESAVGEGDSGRCSILSETKADSHTSQHGEKQTNERTLPRIQEPLWLNTQHERGSGGQQLTHPAAPLTLHSYYSPHRGKQHLWGGLLGIPLLGGIFDGNKSYSSERINVFACLLVGHHMAVLMVYSWSCAQGIPLGGA